MNDSWKTPYRQDKPGNEKVHVWRISLAEAGTEYHRMAQLLSADETLRVNRFYSATRRRQFIVSHAWLRVVLGRYLQIRPEWVEVELNSYGKPYLNEKTNPGGLKFNLAHSEELALLAVATGREVGIDLEFIRPLPDMKAMAESVFSEKEQAVFFGLPEEQKLETFFNGWTRKEAYIKAIGMGMHRSLKQFDVSMVQGEPARLLEVRGLPGEGQRWEMKAFSPEPGFVAALVVDGFRWEMEMFTVSESMWPGDLLV